MVLPNFPRGRTTTSLNYSIEGDLSKDKQMLPGPEDSISHLSWSPKTDLLAVASWDSTVRVYDVNTDLSCMALGLLQFNGPVLSCTWSPDGSKVFGASTDRTAHMVDLNSNGGAQQQVALHDGPIRSICSFELANSNGPLIATGSWDSTVRYWDLRQEKPLGIVDCKGRVYAMDTQNDLFIVGTAEHKVHVIDLKMPTVIKSTVENKASEQIAAQGGDKHNQIRALALLSDGPTFAVGGIDGRCRIFSITDADKNWSWKCHRDTDVKNKESDVYAINSICVYPKLHGVIATAGSDGGMAVWSLDRHERLKHYGKLDGPISAMAFNHTARVLAYAHSYDWSKGWHQHTKDHPNKLMLHPVAPNEYEKPGPMAPRKSGR